MEEQRTLTPRVVGSNPTSGTMDDSWIISTLTIGAFLVLTVGVVALTIFLEKRDKK